MKNRHVVVTGAAQGLGAAYARAFAEQGARVVVADINLPGANSVARSITDAGGEALPLELDVTDEASVAAGFATAGSTFGDVDVLVNNAGGVFGWVQAEEVTLSDWNRTLALTLTSAWLCARAVIPAMKARGRGRIVNVVSSTIDRGLPTTLSPYVAAKGGVATLTRALARELGAYGITVNAVAPGLIVMDKGPQFQPLSDAVVTEQSIPRPGTPDDIVGAVVFLASDAAAFITGQVLNADGGWAFR